MRSIISILLEMTRLNYFACQKQIAGVGDTVGQEITCVVFGSTVLLATNALLTLQTRSKVCYNSSNRKPHMVRIILV
jgi:hypothetical protein